MHLAVFKRFCPLPGRSICRLKIKDRFRADNLTYLQLMAKLGQFRPEFCNGQCQARDWTSICPLGKVVICRGPALQLWTLHERHVFRALRSVGPAF
jgi:hypothetical protein